MQDSDFLLKEKYNSKRSWRFYIDLLKLKLGYPLSYLLGKQPFLDLNIDLKYKPLIPRPETEFWLSEYVLSDFADKNDLKALDIFAGSGAIGLALAKHSPQTQVTLSDKYTKAVKQIKTNAKLNKIENIEIVQSDVFDKIDGRFDLILANPPYVSGQPKDTSFSLSVLFFEPLEAVFSKKRGLFFVEKLLKEAKAHMKPNAMMFIEFDPWQKSEIKKLAQKYDWKYFEFLNDQYGKPRIVQLKLAD